MSSNTNDIKYNDFKNICRTCLFNSDLKPLQNNVIIEVLHNITGIRLEVIANEELPQQICGNCFEKINKIHEFAFKCKQTHSSLIKCLNNFKNTRTSEEIIDETNEIKTEEKITIEEHTIEFVRVEDLKIKQEIIEDTNNQLNEYLIPEQNYFPNADVNIKTEIEETSNLNDNINPLESIEDISNQTKDKKFSCDICNKKFMYLASFKRHRNLHSGGRPYVCNICNKAFAEAGTLKGHKRTHSGERPYKCDICFKAYTGANNLKLHQVKHSGEYPFKCDICDKAFNDVRILRTHMATHSSERPFECEFCTKTFKLQSDLIRHRKTHSIESPYECNICQKTFQYSSTLVRHKRIHSGERPYKCDLCPQGFIESGALKKHKLMHEKGKIK